MFFCPSLGLPKDLLPSGFPVKILYDFLIQTMRATCLADPILHDLITRIIYGERYNLWSSSLCSLLQPPATSCLLGLNILLSTLFSNPFNLCHIFSVRYLLCAQAYWLHAPQQTSLLLEWSSQREWDGQGL
jgi:hypothetical protein